MAPAADNRHTIRSWLCGEDSPSLLGMRTGAEDIQPVTITAWDPSHPHSSCRRGCSLLDKSKKMCQMGGWGEEFTKPAEENNEVTREDTQGLCPLHWVPGDNTLREATALPKEHDCLAGFP